MFKIICNITLDTENVVAFKLQGCQICSLPNAIFSSDTITPSEVGYSKVIDHFNQISISNIFPAYINVEANSDNLDSLKYIALGGFHSSLRQGIFPLDKFILFSKKIINVTQPQDEAGHSVSLHSSSTTFTIKESVEVVKGSVHKGHTKNTKWIIDGSFNNYLFETNKGDECPTFNKEKDAEFDGTEYHEYLNVKAVREIKMACNFLNPYKKDYSQCMEERNAEHIKSALEMARKDYERHERIKKGYKMSYTDFDESPFKIRECVMKEGSDYDILTHVCSIKDEDFIISGTRFSPDPDHTIPGNDILTITCGNFEKNLKFGIDENVAGLTFALNATEIIT